MNQLKFISFYTIDTIYEKSLCTHLLPSLQEFNLSHWIKGIPNKGSWRQNTIQKPPTILEALYKFSEDIVWVDVDAKINEYPSLLFRIPQGFDIAVHYLSWELHYGRPTDKGKFDMLDGTIFVRNNDKMKNFVQEWLNKSTKIDVNHQKVLQSMLKENDNINVYHLPREYCYVTSTPKGLPPKTEINNPIISHYQLSRTAKKEGLK